jgi:Domain of unknown function (DUF4145)
MADTIRQFWCPDCQAHMQLIVDGRHGWQREEGEPGTMYYFGHCVRCRHPGLISEMEIGPDEWSPQTQEYPAPRSVEAKLPPRVEESFREAVRCEIAGAPLATAVMVRRTLEAIGRTFDEKARTLAEVLRTMKNKGLISEELAQWGDALRFIGNIGAHPTGSAVTVEDAREALDFLVAIVETIYVLRPKFQKMKARRDGTKTGAVAEESPGEEEVAKNA